MQRQLRLLAGVVVVMAAGCNLPPVRTWVRFEPAGPSEWRSAGGLLVGRLHEADVQIDLTNKQTKVQVTVENRSAQALEFRVGPDDATPHGAVGQVLLRQLDAGVVGGPETMEYNAKQPQSVAAGWRATFFLDRPLGRDVVLDQRFVLGIEARDPAGSMQRRALPLRAVSGGTIPADGF